MIEGLSHITLVCKDIERTGKMIEYLFNGKEIYSSGEKTYSLSKEKFYDISGIWIALMDGNPLKERTYNHIAFKINEEEYENYLKKIEYLKLDLKTPRPRVEGEGNSIYFYDFDNHLFELHTGTIEERMKKYNNK